MNRTPEKAAVKAFDMSHCVPWFGETSIIGGGIEESVGAQVIIVTVGTRLKKDGNRMDVVKRNLDICKELIPELAALSPEAVFITVTNPVDIMAYGEAMYSGLSKHRVLGSGTLLDTLRFESFIAEAAGVSSDRVDGLVIGEHGESMVPIWSQVRIDGINLEQYLKDNKMEWDQSVRDAIEEKTRRVGWRIREGNQHSSYGIAFSAAMISERILQEKQAVLPVSIYHHILDDSKGFFMSMPVKLDRNGRGEMQLPELNSFEKNRLDKSAEILKQHILFIEF